MSAGRFQDKVALVTGAASGIGRATAVRLASEGAAVACLDVVADGVEVTAASISADGGTATHLVCDVTDQASVQRCVASAVDGFGQLDVVCNIAGIGRFCPTLDLDRAEWDRIIGINLTGTFLVAQAALPHLLDRDGVIVNTASTSATLAQPYQAAYCASKGGVLMLTKALAVEYIGRRLRVNAIAPGGVDTPVLAAFADLPPGVDVERLMRYTTPMGFAQPEDLASLFAYVASPEAHYMTGSIVTMDGGITV